MEETRDSYRFYDPNMFMAIYEHMLCLRKKNLKKLRLFGVLLISCCRKSSKYN
jgi:hypothetical protein